jgi:hypothetical protein
MLKAQPAHRRHPKLVPLSADFVVVGGGLAGCCCAVTAARAGSKVVLIQDRPVLGGNASSEVRLWILGATSHMGNNNRWAREGGVIDEILVENIYRNPEGNPLIVDTIILEKVACEPNITLLLNTAVHDLEKRDADTVKTVRAFCSQNSTAYEISGPLFCDASGDGILGFLSGAAFRMGEEAASEFGEKFAPRKAGHQLLGHSIYFYSKNTGRPVRFIPPSFALADITKIPRYRDFNTNEDGCRLWWIEWGGDLDTVHETETIKWELWKVAYGVWNYINNSGKFPEAENLTLEWVGTIPGKRESRRFEGDYVLTQPDIVEQREHADAVSFGGWAIDLHPSDGVFSEKPGCQQWHSKGVYQIPSRCLYSRNIKNLFLAGRLISASHIAFGSARVMATCAHSGQAVALAAVICQEHGLQPREVGRSPFLNQLQQRLLRFGQYIPGVARTEANDLAQSALLTASSELRLAQLKPGGETRSLDCARAMLLPVKPGPMPRVTFLVDVAEATELVADLRISSKPGNYTPDLTLRRLNLQVKPGQAQEIRFDFDATIDQPRYAFVCLMENPKISVHLSEQRLTGVLSVAQKFNRAVAKSPRQEPPPDTGLDSLEFWLPERRPGGKNLAIRIEPPLEVFGVSNLTNGFARPTRQPNAWVASFEDEQPCVRLTWAEPQTFSSVELMFDTDHDHPMESVLLGHPERVMPFCVPKVVVLDAREVRDTKAIQPTAAKVKTVGASGLTPEFLRGENGNGRGDEVERDGNEATRFPGLLGQLVDNHETRRVLRFDHPVTTDCLEIHLTAPSDTVPAALFEVRCYA